MSDRNSPVTANSAQPTTMSALEIITSKLLALIVRALTIPIGVATIMLAAIDLTDATPQYRPFLIALVFSLTYNIIDASLIIFEVWKSPSPIARTSLQRYQ
ncbi:hypothetical protein FKW77_008111 [Venturia effusa]|uniref:Uncharacterized protein n=1 Tax=Venturia effusa TaxID=50376 RepID=A0A517L9Q0_9PEZI|nr:hypothetical protein FKW77_008111 [Venturia effusa]